MTFLEKSLEDIIFETPNHLLNERGLNISGTKKRQVRIGNYGVSDLITLNREFPSNSSWLNSTLYLNIYELKQNKVDANTLMQGFRYSRGIKRWLDKRLINRGFSNEFEINVILIGREISSGDFCYLADEIQNLTVYTYDYRFDGIKFHKERGYKLREEGF